MKSLRFDTGNIKRTNELLHKHPLQPNATPKFAGQHSSSRLRKRRRAGSLRYEVYENTTKGTEGTKIGEFSTPNSNDRTHFDLSNVIAGRLSAPSTGRALSSGVDFIGRSASITSTDRVAREYRVKLFNYTGSKGSEEPTCVVSLAFVKSPKASSHKERKFSC